MLRRTPMRILVTVTLFGMGGIFALALFFPTHGAQALDTGVNVVQRTIQLSGTDIRVIIARIIQVALGLLGIIALVIVLRGGFLWMTAGGEEEKVSTAKQSLTQGAIGLAIILLAFAITQFILNALVAATTGAGSGLNGSESGIVLNSGSLGRGIIDMHYPTRGQTGVARNSNIIITFKTPIQLASIISGYDDAGTPGNLADDHVSEYLNINAVKIFKAAEGPTHALATDKVRVRFTPDRKTFVFDPVDLLGSASENILYTVQLPSGGLRLENGQAAFTGSFSGGYEWQFETGTFIDLTPPTVTDFFPFPATRASPPAVTGTYERNVLIQVNFSEPIDPSSVVNPGNVTVSAGGATVSGAWQFGNNYRSIEFTTTDACGENSCGETIYCLPGNATIATRVRAADLTPETDDGPAAVIPYTGVADAAGNSLNDQGGNAVAEGSPIDDVSFSFGTSAAIDTTGPTITSVTPGVLTGDIAPDVPVVVNFSEVMSRASLNTDSLKVLPTPDHELWYSVRSEYLYPSDAQEGTGATPIGTRAILDHALFLQTPAGRTPQQGYVPMALPGARDAYQNCFVPSGGPGATAGATCTPNPYCCNGVPSTSASCGASGTAGVHIGP